MKAPVVVLIFANKPRLDWFEEISFRQCLSVLHKHPIRLVCPVGLDVDSYRRIAPEIEIDCIPRHWMASLRAYNRLKILPWLYRRYATFDFILTYELDAFVFKDELLDWCAQGWDYIGAPWFEGWHLAGSEAKPGGVGNSGFSLRRTEAMLRVSRTLRYQLTFAELYQRWKEGRCNLKRSVAALTFRNNFFSPFNDYPDHEDVFWGLLVAERFPWYRVAPYSAARAFSFEVNPSRLYDECALSLPFGCHKWMTYEPNFWRKHIEQSGHSLP